MTSTRCGAGRRARRGDVVLGRRGPLPRDAGGDAAGGRRRARGRSPRRRRPAPGAGDRRPARRHRRRTARPTSSWRSPTAPCIELAPEHGTVDRAARPAVRLPRPARLGAGAPRSRRRSSSRRRRCRASDALAGRRRAVRAGATRCGSRRRRCRRSPTSPRSPPRLPHLGIDVVSTLPLYAAFLDEPFDPSPYAPVSRAALERGVPRRRRRCRRRPHPTVGDAHRLAGARPAPPPAAARRGQRSRPVHPGRDRPLRRRRVPTSSTTPGSGPARPSRPTPATRPRSSSAATSSPSTSPTASWPPSRAPAVPCSPSTCRSAATRPATRRGRPDAVRRWA